MTWIMMTIKMMLMMILVLSRNVSAWPVVESPRGAVVALQVLLRIVLVPHNQNAQWRKVREQAYQCRSRLTEDVV